MNASHPINPTATAEILNQQRRAFFTEEPPTLAQRKANLKKLRDAVSLHIVASYKRRSVQILGIVLIMKQM